MSLLRKLKIRIENIHISLPVGLVLLAFALNLLIEMLSRHSVFAGVAFLCVKPFQFFYGMLVIGFTLIIGCFFRRRVFSITLISGMWVIVGLVNCVVRIFRHTPFTAQDLRLIEYAVQVAPVYLNVFSMILIVVAFALFVAAMVVWWKKAPVSEAVPNRFRALIFLITAWLVCWGYSKIGVTFGVFADNFGNIGDAYNKYGFEYCFVSSLLNSGIDKPDNYNEEAIKEILERIEELESASQAALERQTSQSALEQETSQADVEVSVKPIAEAPTPEKPNVIFLQLESLFDVSVLKNVEYSKEVLPNINRLKKEYSSGLLSVPSFGAGTANTEFEVLSGMNLDDFGPGEYPYKTALVKNVCESIAYYLKPYGYTANALHDNDGTFYDRYKVFSKLGFDTFTSIEYMDEIERNDIGWADDSILVGEIMEILSKTTCQDFVYTVSVQGHGDYPEDYEIKDTDITASGETVDEYLPQFTYYINQASQMDEFVGELIEALEKKQEPTVLVLYGDHYPAFDIEDDDVSEGNIYTTRYVIWDNIGLSKEDLDLQSYQLSSYVMSRIGFEGGAISKYHSSMAPLLGNGGIEEEEYLDGLRLLEYDILYGDKDCYEGNLPYNATNLKMGHKDIGIRRVSSNSNVVVILGQNFTPFSYVMVNGEECESVCLDSKTLIMYDYSLKNGDSVAVVQKGTDGVILSGTSLYIYRN